MNDTLNVSQTIIDMLNAVDSHEWERVRACFDTQVLADYTSFAGGEPAVLEADQLIDSWKGFLPGFAMTFHQVSNFQVQIEGNEASCFSYLNALHSIPDAMGGEHWTLIGTYEHKLLLIDGAWRITAMKLNVLTQIGNMGLPALAQERMGR
ncbi:MAG: hypothetical protein CL946_12900 [Ectothiorhodospiraceae bacterium]|nr:hypothetical protein [Ectothiorhodospiraceae bacterium]